MSDFSTESTVTARKAHKCCECATVIYPGEQYIRVAGAFDGSAYAYKMCPPCRDTFNWLDSKLREGPYDLNDDEGIEFGNLRGELKQWLANAQGDDQEAQRRLDEMNKHKSKGGEV